MAKNSKKANKDLPKGVSIRINPDDEDDFAELFRRMRAAGFAKPSTYIKHLLSAYLHPDPTGDKAIRDVLRQIHDATDALQAQVDKLDAQTKSIRQAVAKSTTMLLIKIADMPADKARKWVQENLME
ncbi:MAG: hypothetical protein WD738_19810 [Pirellulales bacterium]